MPQDKWPGEKQPFDFSSLIREGKLGKSFRFNLQPASHSRADQPKEVGFVDLPTPLAFDPKQATQYFPFAKFLTIADGSQYILDENGITILLFEGKQAGGFTRFYSPRPAREVTQQILGLPEDQQETLREHLHLPDPTEADRQVFTERKRRVQEEEELLNTAFSLPSRTAKSKAARPSHSRGILQQEYGITDARSSEPVIGTYGLGPCIALVVYDRKTQTAAVAHIDAMLEVESIDRMLYQIGEDREQWEIGLVGGEDGSSRKTAVNLLQYLQRRGLTPAYADIMSKSHPTAFVIDARTGEIIPNVHPSDSGENEHLRMQLVGLNPYPQLNEEFDGRRK